MSNIYIQEPPTNGKVLLVTSVGDVDIELWSREAPRACRNFVQLCLEGYYDGLLFHRVIKGFIAQTGDPTGTGHGGESVYGRPFRDEFHSRLRFNRRGMVGMANAGQHDNGSQFFFTLGEGPELNNKHTLFGKVAGNTVFNMIKLGDVEIQNERPVYPLKILKTKVLSNPFDDIVPRKLPKRHKSEEDGKKPKSKSKATKNFSLLSFGEEAEEDEEETNRATENLKTKSKSSHDLLDDKRLSSVPAVETEMESTSQKRGWDEQDSDSDTEEKQSRKEAVRKKLKRNTSPEPVEAENIKREPLLKKGSTELEEIDHEWDERTETNNKTDLKAEKEHLSDSERKDRKKEHQERKKDDRGTGKERESSTNRSHKRLENNSEETEVLKGSNKELDRRRRKKDEKPSNKEKLSSSAKSSKQLKSESEEREIKTPPDKEKPRKDEQHSSKEKESPKSKKKRDKELVLNEPQEQDTKRDSEKRKHKKENRSKSKEQESSSKADRESQHAPRESDRKESRYDSDRKKLRKEEKSKRHGESPRSTKESDSESKDVRKESDRRKHHRDEKQEVRNDSSSKDVKEDRVGKRESHPSDSEDIDTSKNQSHKKRRKEEKSVSREREPARVDKNMEVSHDFDVQSPHSSDGGSPNNASLKKNESSPRKNERSPRSKERDSSKPRDSGEEGKKNSSRVEELRKEVLALERDIALSKRKRARAQKMKTKEKEVAEPPEPEPDDNDVVAAFKKERLKYKQMKMGQPRKGSKREAETLALLNKFQAKLGAAKKMREFVGGPEDDEEEEGEAKEDEEDMDNEGSMDYSWMSHELHFESHDQKVMDANIDEADRYTIFDPRNPLNKRRREASKQKSKSSKS